LKKLTVTAEELLERRYDLKDKINNQIERLQTTEEKKLGLFLFIGKSQKNIMKNEKI